MSTELHWPRESTFHDPRGVDGDELYFEGPGTFEVPDQRVDHYLDRGWQQPEEAEPSDAPAAAAQEPEPDADSGEATEEGASEGFDAAGFVDESWQSVTSQIEDGEADDHLDAVEAAERDRDGEPRSSVIEAIEERR